MKEQKLKGKIIATRVHHMNVHSTAQSCEECMSIDIEDDISGLRVCEVRMSMSEFTKMLTASHAKCEIFRVKGAPIGQKYENKKVFIPHRLSSRVKNDETLAEAKDMIEPLEVDGWNGRVEDLFNWNNRATDDKGIEGYNVNFFRWIEVDEGNTGLKK